MVKNRVEALENERFLSRFERILSPFSLPLPPLVGDKPPATIHCVDKANRTAYAQNPVNNYLSDPFYPHAHDCQGAADVNQKIKSAAFLIATASAALACTQASGAGNSGSNSTQNVPPSNGPAIYKIVDASGRVTYTNAPTKGAAKVELDPITVIPATPAGVLGGSKVAAQAGAPFIPAASPSTSPELIPVGIAPTIAAPEFPTPVPAPTQASTTPTFAASLRATPSQPATAVVTAISKPAPVVQASLTKLPVVKLSPPANDTDLSSASAATSVTPPTTTLAAFVTPAPVTPAPLAAVSMPTLQQRSVARSVESNPPPTKIDEEERQLAEAKGKLDDEQRTSASFRALRARLPATIDQSNPAKAAIQNDIKAQVEQHFERIRQLQDQISLHEQNLAALRQTPRAQGSNALSSVANSTASRQIQTPYDR